MQAQFQTNHWPRLRVYSICSPWQWRMRRVNWNRLRRISGRFGIGMRHQPAHKQTWLKKQMLHCQGLINCCQQVMMLCFIAFTNKIQLIVNIMITLIAILYICHIYIMWPSCDYYISPYVTSSAQGQIGAFWTASPACSIQCGEIM